MFPKMICRFSVTTMQILMESDTPHTICIELQKKSLIDKVMPNKNKTAEIIASDFKTL